MAAMKTQQPDEELCRAIDEALKQVPDVAAAYLYGSSARGQRTPLSDVDVALVAGSELRDDERGAVLRKALVALARRRRGVTFDVRFLDELPAAIGGRVVGEGALVFERDAARRVRAEVRARMLYHDFLPFEAAGTSEGIAGLRKQMDVG
jgi:predicted nucleotidyltransferase